MLSIILRKTRYAMMLFNAGGAMLFLRQFGRQIYSKATFWGLEKRLDATKIDVASGLEYHLRPASEDDIEEMLKRTDEEGRDSVHDLLQRKWFYDCGFHDCYVGRTADGGDLCYIQWLVSRKDESALNKGFQGRLPNLKEDEILVENAFTFKRYRGNGVYPSALVRLAEISRGKGFKRMLVYVKKDNIASLRGCEKAGFEVFERVPEVKFLFLTKRKHT
jgi:hypothetical protein